MRVRLCWTKQGRIRFCGHRDSARIWERAVRRADLPVSYTQGYTPRAKIAFGLALAVGQESVAEYLDVDLRLSQEEAAGLAADLPERLSAVLPEGMAVSGARPLKPGAASLQEAVTSCTWEFALGPADRGLASDWVGRVQSAESLPLERERKGRRTVSDVRTAVGGLRLADSRSGSVLVAELGTKPRAVRPAEFLRLTVPPLAAGRIRRLHQWIMRDGERYEPLAPPAGVLAPTGGAPAAAGCRAVPAAQPEVCAE
ncbi:MAG: TIGR03936 family radical SAM-associated protein [bacterium]|nr:TIGR03936 family radical SAM-associated protein [bacterium]